MNKFFSEILINDWYVNCLQHSQGLSGDMIHCYLGGLDPDFCGCVTVTFGVNIEYCASRSRKTVNKCFLEILHD